MLHVAVGAVDGELLLFLAVLGLDGVEVYHGHYHLCSGHAVEAREVVVVVVEVVNGGRLAGG